MLVSLFGNLIRPLYSFAHDYLDWVWHMRGMIKVEELRSVALKTRDEKRHIPQLLAVLGEEDKAEQGFYYGTFMLKKEFFLE